MKTRAAVAFEAKKPLELLEIDLEGPQEGEVLVEIKATGICHTDAYTLSGKDPEGLFPSIMGHEGAGIVQEVGKSVKGLKQGDHVIPLYTPECRECDYCLNPKTNLCQSIRTTQGQGLMPNGTSRFSYKGKTIYHYMGTSTFSNFTVLPEIALAKMGALIKGAGNSEIIIEGVKELKGCNHKVIPDRIEAGSFAIAAAITNGSLELYNCEPKHLESLSKKLINAGVNWESKKDIIKITSDGNLKPVDVQTAEYPDFPTDLQAQFMTLMSVANGNSKIIENIFENRFMHVPELLRMGANISVNGGVAKVSGVKNLKGAQIMATDLRASISLVIAALKAEGESYISRIYHLDRGYEKIEQKFQDCGANIERIMN